MAFAGKWVLSNSENLDAVFDALGVPAAAREKAGVKSTVEMSKNGDVFNIKVSGEKKSVDQTFKLDEPFTETYGLHGQTREAVATNEGGKLVIKGTGSGKIDQLVETREVSGNQMIVTLTVGGVSAKRVYDRA